MYVNISGYVVRTPWLTSYCSSDDRRPESWTRAPGGRGVNPSPAGCRRDLLPAVRVYVSTVVARLGPQTWPYSGRAVFRVLPPRDARIHFFTFSRFQNWTKKYIHVYTFMTISYLLALIILVFGCISKWNLPSENYRQPRPCPRTFTVYWIVSVSLPAVYRWTNVYGSLSLVIQGIGEKSIGFDRNQYPKSTRSV